MSWLHTESPRTIPKNMTPSPDYFNFAERDEYLANVLPGLDCRILGPVSELTPALRSAARRSFHLGSLDAHNLR